MKSGFLDSGGRGGNHKKRKARLVDYGMSKQSETLDRDTRFPNLSNLAVVVRNIEDKMLGADGKPLKPHRITQVEPSPHAEAAGIVPGVGYSEVQNSCLGGSGQPSSSIILETNFVDCQSKDPNKSIGVAAIKHNLMGTCISNVEPT